MEVHILASGSSGNCIAVRSGSTTILIDAGIPKTKIERRLLDAGIRPDRIAAIFITHAHKDHVKGLPFANKYSIPVYASEGEWRDIRGMDEGLKYVISKDHGLYEPIPFDMHGFAVIPFGTHHDAFDPLGYTVVGDQTVSICLDTGHVDDGMLAAMEGSDIYIIEANHDPDLVAVSDYPESVKSRILSDRGHLSNQQAAEVLAKLIRGRGERIYLTHLSEQNNMPALALATVEAELRRRGFENGKHYFCEVV
jgi:phosphoribosyl 1,2-cyclic phosphodiesterase